MRQVKLWTGGTADVPDDHPMFKSEEELKAAVHMSEDEVYPVPMLRLGDLTMVDVGQMGALFRVESGGRVHTSIYLGGDDLTKLRNWLAAICGE